MSAPTPAWQSRIVGHGAVAPASLLPHPQNWRTHPRAQVDALSGAIGEVGYVRSVTVSKRSGRIIDGHLRVELAVRDGVPRIPVEYVDLSEAEETLALATLDPLAALAGADKKNLDAILRQVQTGNEALGAMLEATARAAGVVYGTPATDAEPQVDRAEELREKWGVETGQLWLVGENRLMCGNSTRAEDVARCMGGEKADLCFTSPPYAQQRDYKAKITDWDGLMQGVFGNLPMTDKGQVLVNLGLVHKDGEWWPYWDGWIEWMRAQGWKRFGWYVWDKQFAIPGDHCGRFAPSHEFIFHFNRVPVKPVHCVEKKEASICMGGGRTLRHGDGLARTTCSPEASLNTHKIPDSVFRITTAHTGGKVDVNHPAVYPVALPSLAMDAWPGSTYDPFLGSGTTMVAAQNLSRRCFGIEVAPAYCAVVLERMHTAFPHLEILKS